MLLVVQLAAVIISIYPSIRTAFITRSNKEVTPEVMVVVVTRSAGRRESRVGQSRGHVLHRGTYLERNWGAA